MPIKCSFSSAACFFVPDGNNRLDERAKVVTTDFRRRHDFHPNVILPNATWPNQLGVMLLVHGSEAYNERISQGALTEGEGSVRLTSTLR
jgi:hypothetical protein